MSQMDVSKLVAAMHEAYSAALVDPDRGSLMGSVSAKELEEMSSEEVLSRTIRQKPGNNITIRFRGGRYPTRHDFVPIPRIDINRESIVVGVEGVGAVAEQVVTDVAEIMWHAAGVVKKWKEIERGLVLKAYGTATRVDFGRPLERLLLNPDLMSFIDSDVISGRCFGAAMGQQSARHEFKPNSGIVAAPNLDELTLQVNTFDPVGGRDRESGKVTSRSPSPRETRKEPGSRLFPHTCLMRLMLSFSRACSMPLRPVTSLGRVPNHVILA